MHSMSQCDSIFFVSPEFTVSQIFRGVKPEAIPVSCFLLFLTILRNQGHEAGSDVVIASRRCCFQAASPHQHLRTSGAGPWALSVASSQTVTDPSSSSSL